MKKRWIIAGAVIAGVLLAVTGAVFGIKALRNKGKTAEVVSVEMLNYGYEGDSLESEGVVINGAAQRIYPENGQIVKEVYVTEGQSVAKGDRLLAFDITSLQLSAEIQKLELGSQQNQYAAAIKKLDALKKTRPVSVPPAARETEPPVTAEPVTTPEPEKTNLTPLPEKKRGTRYQYLDAGCSAETIIPPEDGAKEQWQYLCVPEIFVCGSFLNQIAGTDREYLLQAVGEDGEPVASLCVSGTWFSDTYDAQMRWYPFVPEADMEETDDPHMDQEAEAPAENEVEEAADPVEEDFSEEPEGYTAAELAAAIREAEAEVKKRDLAIRKAKLELEMLEKELKDGVVYAKIDGVVKSVSDPSHPPADGSPFLEISGSGGMYVRGAVSELKLDAISVGQTVQCMDYETGNTVSGTIQSIDDYPGEDLYYYGECNPNSSMYAYTAYVEDTGALKEGQYLSVTVTPEDGTTDAIYIDKAYVRTDAARPYVMKDVDGRLVRQEVTTGKSLWGSAVEICAGLQMEDYIAFPYGPAAKEGIRTLAVE